MNAPWLLIANHLKGLTEIKGAATAPEIAEMFRISGHPEEKQDETPWCAAFVGACLRLAGYASSGGLNARSYLNFGRKLDTPEPGCIVVFWRDSKASPHGHVAFFDHLDNSNIWVLGGNQGDRVCVAAYPKARLLGYFWPTEQQTPATSPIIPNITQLMGAANQPAPEPMAPAPAMAAVERPAVPPPVAPAAVTGTSNFGQIQEWIFKWEGGYVDDPNDPGGATNMGITIATLSTWRGRQVSKDEVKSLTRTEAAQIFKARYYDLVRGDDLPMPVALATYNAAVMSGVSVAGLCLQNALRKLGKQVGIDGAVGPETVNAANECDPQQLAAAVFDVYEARLRSLANFARYGKGWMNRVNDMRRAAVAMGKTVVMSAEPVAPAPVAVQDGGPPNQLPPAQPQVAQPPANPPQPNQPPAVPPDLAAQAKVLTPVNAALGDTIGSYLNGRKTGLGTIGLMASTLLQNGAIGGTSPVMDALHTTVPQYGIPISAALTAWGVLGKVDKWVAGVKQ